MKALYRKLIFSILSRLSGSAFCLVYNFIMQLNGRFSRCKFLNGIYFLTDMDGSLWFTRSSRYRYYADGINARLSDLFAQYTGDFFEIRKGDVVLDCGANIGEFSIFCQSKGAITYAFEPDATEFGALSRNLKEGNCLFPVALWFEATRLSFELQNDTGDSTVVVGTTNVEHVEVEGARLDSFPEVMDHSKIRLLKLEAEGFELEVLRGATGLLKKIEYIAADLGPERGPTNESSLPDVVNFLLKEGFVIEHFLPTRSIILFKNISII